MEQLSFDLVAPRTRFDTAQNGEAYQYVMRRQYAESEKEYPYWKSYDLSLEKSVVKEVSYKTAKDVIEKYEWLGCMPMYVKKCYGIFFPHKTEDAWLLGGVTVFANEYAENTGVWDKYGYTNKIILLARGVNMHFCPINANSHLVMESIKQLPEKYEVVTCTIDPLAGEVGTIYQACNFHYVGVMRKNKSRVGCIINGKLYGSRALRQKYGTQSRERIMEMCPDARFIEQKAKGRYFYFRGDKRVRRKNYRAIKPLIKPYPKRS